MRWKRRVLDVADHAHSRGDSGTAGDEHHVVSVEERVVVERAHRAGRGGLVPLGVQQQVAYATAGDPPHGQVIVLPIRRTRGDRVGPAGAVDEEVDVLASQERRQWLLAGIAQPERCAAGRLGDDLRDSKVQPLGVVGVDGRSDLIPVVGGVRLARCDLGFDGGRTVVQVGDPVGHVVPFEVRRPGTAAVGGRR